MTEPAVVLRAGARLVAAPLQRAVETMRFLPTAPLPSAPPYVLGASIIRGQPTPVVDVAALLGDPTEPPTRLLTVRAASRTVALAASEVLGVWELGGAPRLHLPTVLEAADDAVVAAVAARGSELLVVLRSTRLVPPPVWAALQERA
jgi:purine-binding chemotaxis protein CheW